MAPAQFYLGKSGRRSGLALPADAVTRTFGIFGVKDSGKTTTARTLAEGIVKCGGHVVILDPVGVWWGITRAGEGPGLPGIVIGGEHGDVPLEETGGQLVAELCVSRQWPVVVVDLKLLRKGAAQRFLADYLETVYHENRRPLHVVFEEADRALPQNPRGMDPTLGRVLGAAEDIVKLGRSRGLGSTFLSQRMATVTKNVTEQVQALVLHAQPGPRDRKAVKEWVEANGDTAATAKVMDSMASLDQGTAWFYSPAWLKTLELVHVRRPQTLDSSSTPTNDEREVEEQAKRAPVDLDELRTMMAETVQRAEARDPRKLAERVEALEAEVEEARAAAQEVRVLVPDREAMATLAEERAAVESFFDELRAAEAEQREKEAAFVARIEAYQRQWEQVIAGIESLLDGAAALPPEGAPQVVVGPAAAGGEFPSRESQRVRDALPTATLNGDGPSRGALELAQVLANVHPLAMNRGQLALLARRGAKSSTLTQHLAELTAAGLVENDRGRYRACGPEVAGAKAPTLRELRQRFLDVLPDGPRALFAVLLDSRTDLGRDDLFRAAGFSPTSSTPVGHLKLLTDNGLAEREAGAVRLGRAVR